MNNKQWHFPSTRHASHHYLLACIIVAHCATCDRYANALKCVDMSAESKQSDGAVVPPGKYIDKYGNIEDEYLTVQHWATRFVRVVQVGLRAK